MLLLTSKCMLHQQIYRDLLRGLAETRFQSAVVAMTFILKMKFHMCLILCYKQTILFC
jgi:hypothetical protein